MGKPKASRKKQKKQKSCMKKCSTRCLAKHKKQRGGNDPVTTSDVKSATDVKPETGTEQTESNMAKSSAADNNTELDSGKVEKLQGKVTELEGKITELKGKVAELEGKVAALEGNGGQVKSSVTHAEPEAGESQGLFSGFKIPKMFEIPKIF
tara:strand:- start:197 stop:652 length:456 start_codon:yes stop_codon:yes gene_type:complete